MTKREFQTILQESASQEFAHIPQEQEIDLAFSNRFAQRMEKLIRSQKQPWYSMVNSVSKRVAVIVLIFAILFSCALSVDAIGKPILDATSKFASYVMDFLKTHNGIGVHGDPNITISTEYRLTYLPQGFYQTDVQKETYEMYSCICYTYRNPIGEIILFKQMEISEDVGVSLDSANDRAEKLWIGEREVLLCIDADGAHATWAEETYLLSVYYFGLVDKETMISLVNGVQ